MRILTVVSTVFLLTIWLSCIDPDGRRTHTSKSGSGGCSKVNPSSVSIMNYDPKSKAAHGGRFSGVVIDEDGRILTTAHAASPDNITKLHSLTEGNLLRGVR